MNEQIKKDMELLENWEDFLPYNAYQDLTTRIENLLAAQARVERARAVEEVIEVLKLAPIWGINTGLIDHIRAGKAYASWKDVLDKLQSLTNKK